MEQFLNPKSGQRHPDNRRPGAFEAFAREFLCRLDAEFVPMAISPVA